MRKFLFVLTTVFVCSSLLAADIWETREEIDVNGTLAEKSMFISDSVMKVINTSPSGDSETFIDLAADKITIINHKYKSFQTIQLSKYIEFAQQLFNELKEKTGKFEPERLFLKLRSKSREMKSSRSGTAKFGQFRSTANFIPRFGSLLN